MKLSFKKMVINSSASEYPSKFNFNCIDLIKFICSILVCVIHIPVFTSSDFKLGGYVNFLSANAVCRIAVPFFFVAAGFLLFRKINIERIDKDRIQSYCFRILRLLGLWTVLLFVGGTVQLWYLGGLVVAVILLSLLFHFKFPVKYIVVIALVLYVIGLLGDAYFSFGQPLKDIRAFAYLFKLYDDFFDTTRNGVFMGLIFVLIGALFAHKKIKINIYVAFIGFFVSMVMLVGEACLIKHYTDAKDYNMYISLLPAVFFLFYIATHINLKDRKIYGKLRIVSMLVFYMHLFVHYTLNYFFKFINEKLNIDLSDYTLLITLLIAILVAFVIEWLSHKEKFIWLKWLYS